MSYTGLAHVKASGTPRTHDRRPVTLGEVGQLLRFEGEQAISQLANRHDQCGGDSR